MVSASALSANGPARTSIYPHNIAKTKYKSIFLRKYGL